MEATCSRCHEVKPCAEFGKNSKNIRRGGLSDYCRECWRVYIKERKQRDPAFLEREKRREERRRIAADWTALKACHRCKAEKPKTEFYHNRKTLDGLTEACRECVKDIQRARRESAIERSVSGVRAYKHRTTGPKADEYRRKKNALQARRREWLWEQKAAPCGDCGGSFPAVCMDFDHRPGEVKHFAPSSVRSIPKMIAEIAKCDLVCSNCHRIRTHARATEARNAR